MRWVAKFLVTGWKRLTGVRPAPLPANGTGFLIRATPALGNGRAMGCDACLTPSTIVSGYDAGPLYPAGGSIAIDLPCSSNDKCHLYLLRVGMSKTSS